MSTADHKALVAEYIGRVWNEGDAAALEDLTTPSFVYRLGEQPPRDRAAMREFVAMTRSAFPDWGVQIVGIAADGEVVAVRWSGTVTHEGTFHGLPPTGRRVRVSGINMYRIEAGRIAEEWEQTDSLSLLQQLGVLPRP